MCDHLTEDGGNKFKQREKLSAAVLPKIMLSPSTQLRSSALSWCSDLPFLGRLTTRRPGGSQNQTRERRPTSRPLLSIPTARPRRIPPRPARGPCCADFDTAGCRRGRNAAAAFSQTQNAVGRLRRKPVIYSLLHIRSGGGKTRGHS